MKFGKEIQSQQIPGWSPYYLDYKSLKKVVSSLSKKDGRSSSPAEFGTTLEGDRTRVAPSTRLLWAPQSPIVSQTDPPLISTAGSDDDRGPEYQRHKALFFFRLERELEKINTFYLQKEAELKLRLDTLLSKRRIAALHVAPGGTPESSTRDHVEWRAVEEGFRLLQRDLAKLQQFIDINATGFRKILKKWDKRSKSTTKELYLARQVEVQPVFDRKLISELADTVAICLIDLTNVTAGPEYGVSSANEIILSQQLALETSGQMNAFQDLERSLQHAVSANDEVAVIENIQEAEKLSSQATARTPIIRILWKAAIEASPALADLIMFSPPFDFKFVDDINGRTCLHEAAIAGEPRLIDLCLVHEVQSDRQDVYGRTALHYSAMHGHDVVCKRLLEAGISVGTTDLDSYTSLIYATINGHPKCVQTLLNYDVKLLISNSDLRPLTVASRCGHIDIVTMLIDAGAVCEPNSNGEFPIHLAAREGFADICRILLKLPGFDVPDKFNEWTPLFHAVRHGHLDCVEVLLSAGANPHIVDETGRSPVFYAAWYGHLDVLDVLLRASRQLPMPSIKPTSIYSASPTSDTIGQQEEELDLIPSLSLPPPIMPFRVYGHNYLVGTSLIQVTLGHPTSSDAFGPPAPPIQLLPHFTGTVNENYMHAAPSMKLVVTCKSNVVATPFAVNLPILAGDENLVFQLANLDDLSLEFSLYPSHGNKIIGRSILLPSAFKGIKTRGRYVAPLMDHHLHVIGEVSFEVCVVTPFMDTTIDLGGAVETYWKSAATPFGSSSKHHKGLSRSPPTSGQGPLVKNLLPVMNDNTVTSSSLAGDYAHIVVQVTRDLVPVVWNSWHIHVAGLAVGVGDVTVKQFLKLQSSHSQSALSPTKTNSALISLAQVPHSTLQSVMESLPEDLGIFIEVACLTSMMKDDLMLGHSHKLNQVVDSVLKAVYATSGTTQDVPSPRKRKIVFASFHPDVCAALNWKQPNYPVMFASFCGITPSIDKDHLKYYSQNDKRCRSIAAALDFAKANNLLGLIVPASILMEVPPLAGGLKDSGVMVAAFGTHETVRSLEDTLRSGTIALDGVLNDGHVHYADILRS